MTTENRICDLKLPMTTIFMATEYFATHILLRTALMTIKRAISVLPIYWRVYPQL